MFWKETLSGFRKRFKELSLWQQKNVFKWTANLHWLKILGFILRRKFQKLGILFLFLSCPDKSCYVKLNFFLKATSQLYNKNCIWTCKIKYLFVKCVCPPVSKAPMAALSQTFMQKKICVRMPLKCWNWLNENLVLYILSFFFHN